MAETVNETLRFGIPLQELPSYRVKPPVGDKPVSRRETLNVELLEEIMSYIEAHPQTWNQANWYVNVDPETGSQKHFWRIEEVTEQNSCGTSFCFAGHVALREGFPAPPLENGVEWEREVSDLTWGESVDVFAEKVLGIDPEQAEALFAGENTMADLRNMVTALKVSDGSVPGFVLDNLRCEYDVVQSEDEIKSFLRRELGEAYG